MDQATVMITVDELRSALSLLLDEVERRLGPSIDLGADYYWEINPAVAFDLKTTPTQLITVGQLSDDVASVRDFVGQPAGELVVIWHEVGHLAGILRRLAALDLPAATDGPDTA
jgi:hypothetical protein